MLKLVVAFNRAWCGLNNIRDSHAEATTCCSDSEYEQWVQLPWIAVSSICVFIPEEILQAAFWSLGVCSAYNEDHGRRQESCVTMVFMHHIYSFSVFLGDQHSEICYEIVDSFDDCTVWASMQSGRWVPAFQRHMLLLASCLKVECSQTSI